MTIIKRRVTRNYTVIANDCFNDLRLRGEELGVLGYLLSRPHNWSIRLPALKKRMGWGRDKTYSVLNSLAEKAYIERRQERDSVTGSFKSVDYVVYDEPVAKPRPEKPEAEPRPDLPLPVSPKAAKTISKDSEQILLPPLHVHSVDNTARGSAMESMPRSSNAARAYVPHSQQGTLEKQIAERLGENGWEILMALPGEEIVIIFRLHREGKLDEAKIIELKLRHQQMSTPAIKT
ncbi:hypothetical protein [Bradyrhizobium sp. AUGA SZCCT0182]|uniref:hypothetical protein n=1 Tax=Bradyrhizobium sp. AUGA SZCCT0182 TaxID=2807667 RepID=UPI001BA565E9|nr:hypothetical protein [Bradyrhizobium sp. AUGA SZCCT0182]MBR1235186.1 hypothetical protein [Bradyrhizobium sp. AUGA SZCCT0182]